MLAIFATKTGKENLPPLDKEQDSDGSKDNKSKDDGKNNGCHACPSLIITSICSHVMVHLNVIVDADPLKIAGGL